MKKHGQRYYYESINELPYYNYFKSLETGSRVYLFVYRENDPGKSNESIKDAGGEYPDFFNDVWEKLQYEFDVVEYSDTFRDVMEATYITAKIAISDKPQSKLKLKLSRLNEKIEKHLDKTENYDVDKMAINIESMFDFKKDIQSQKYTMSIETFMALERQAIEQVEYRKKLMEENKRKNGK